MKKTLILALAGSLCFSAKAQTQFGIQAGGLLSDITVKNEGKKEEGKKSLFGFKAGVVAKVPFSESVAFMPELNFVNKGGKYESSFTAGSITATGKAKYNLMVVEVPVNFAYTINDGNGTFFAGAGPVISLGLKGKYKWDAVTGGVATNGEQDIKFDGKKDADVTDEDAHLKRVEFGADVFVGYQMGNGLFAKAMYTQGLSNLTPEADASFKTGYLGLAIGFMFGGSSK